MHVYETTFKTVSRGYLDSFNSFFRKDDKSFVVNFIRLDGRKGKTVQEKKKTIFTTGPPVSTLLDNWTRIRIRNGYSSPKNGRRTLACDSECTCSAAWRVICFCSAGRVVWMCSAWMGLLGLLVGGPAVLIEEVKSSFFSGNLANATMQANRASNR